MTAEDSRLVERCLQGSQAAWNELVDRYGRLVYSIPRRYGLGAADADDVFQAAFSALFQQLGRLRDDSKLSSWLITTTHRECWRTARKSNRHPDIDSVIADVSAPQDDDVLRWERQHVVREALAKLGGRCQELLSALFLNPDKPDYETIARQLGIKVGSIGPTRARCFERLQKLLEERGFSAEQL